MKSLSNTVLVLCGLCFLSSLAFAQSDGTIRGAVAAKADNSLLPDTDVRIESQVLTAPLHAKTSVDGRFTFQHLVPGPYTLVATRDGFQEQKMNLSLKPREIQTIAVELTVRGIAQSVDVNTQGDTLAPNSTTLHQQTVDDLPADQRNNLPDMIAATAPGMIRSHDDFVHVRGNEIALNTFINGVSFWENPHSVFSSGLTPDIVQTANVMTGEFPAEYGNRFGGVIDIVTKSGRSMNNQGSVTIGVGSALRHNAAVEWGGHSRRAGYYFYSSAFESARFLSPNDPRSIHDTGRGSHNFLQLDFGANPSNSFKLVMMGDGTNFEIPKTSVDDQIRPNANASQRTREQSTVLTWTHNLVTTSVYERWSRTRLIPSHDPLAAVAQNNRELLTTGLKSDLTRFFGRHVFKGGVDLGLLRPKAGAWKTQPQAAAE